MAVRRIWHINELVAVSYLWNIGGFQHRRYLPQHALSDDVDT